MTNNYLTIDKIFSTVCWKGSIICRDLGLFISTWEFCQTADLSRYCWTVGWKRQDIFIVYYIAMATQGWAVQMGFFFHAINYKLGKPENRSIKAKLAQLKKVRGNFLKKTWQI